MELPLMVVMPMTAAAERSGIVMGSNVHEILVNEHRGRAREAHKDEGAKTGRVPLALERSQPIMAASAMLSASRRRIEPGASSALHGPRSPAIQSVFMLCYLLR